MDVEQARWRRLAAALLEEAADLFDKLALFYYRVEQEGDEEAMGAEFHRSPEQYKRMAGDSRDCARRARREAETFVYDDLTPGAGYDIIVPNWN